MKKEDRRSETPERPLRCGVALPQGTNQELAGMDAESAWHRIESTAALAERLGYDSLWVLDRTETLPRREPCHVFDGWTTLGALARSTTGVGLGHLCLAAPFRNVGVMAKQAACVDVMSGGRLTLGIDPHGYPSEHVSYGLPELDADQECQALTETLSALRAAWRDESRTTFDGRHVRLREAYCLPKPVRSRVPVLVRDQGTGNLDHPTAELGDGVIWHTTPEEFDRRSRLLDQRCADIGRDPAGLTRTMFAECRITESAVERDRWLATPYVVAFWSEHPDLYMRRNLVGTVEAVAQRLQRYIDAGAQQVILWFSDYPQTTSLERFVHEVVPRLTAPAARAADRVDASR